MVLDALDVSEVMRGVDTLLYGGVGRAGCAGRAGGNAPRATLYAGGDTLCAALYAEVVEGGLWARFRGLEISIAAPAQVPYYRRSPVDPLNLVRVAPNLLWEPCNENRGS